MLERLEDVLASLLARPGLLLKRLVLVIGASYFTLVATTNLVNFFDGIGAFHWTFLNSGNGAYIQSITKVYSMPSWFNHLAVLGAFVMEAIGAVLFWRAVVAYRGGGRGSREAWLALCWNVAVWLAFIVGTEFFVAYASESPFRELLVLALAMAVVLAVVPDEAGATGPSS